MESSSSDQSSDEEIQTGLAEGTLQPGLIGKVAPPRTYTNNVSGLREKLAALKRKGQTEWLERMDVTSQTVTRVPSARETEGEAGEEEGPPDPNNDFKREMWFYQQAQSSASIGRRKLEELGIQTTRPDDYFAEMVKTDDHMRKWYLVIAKVRETLLSRQKVLEQREKARKLRELKKFGKKVQQEILQKRREEKKSALDAVKKYRKGRGEKPRFLGGQARGGSGDEEEEKFAVSATSERWQEKARKKGQFGGKSKKRQHKDMKFGLGGRKRGLKANSAASSADMSSFSSAKYSRPSGHQQKRKGGSGGKGQRPGKARRKKQARNRT